jgi:mannose-1-phosphate guanylyltransferase
LKALLLTGGFGTRLRPLIYTRPKHLLPIANVPHIEHVFGLLRRHGINDVILTTSYMAEAFGETVERAQDQGMRLLVTHEETPLGTAGAIKNAQAEIGPDTFVVFNGDVLTNVDLTGVIGFHADNRAEATILLTPVEDPSAYGVVPTDDEDRVTAFVEKPPAGEAPTNLLNAGVYVLEPSVLDRVPPDEEWSIERAVFPQLVADGARVFACAPAAYWLDIGTPDTYREANMDAISGRFTHEGTAVSDGAEVDASAAVSSSCVRDGVRIEAGARVEGSVLLPGVVVSESASVSRCVLGEGVVVDRGIRLSNRTVGDHEKID